MTYLSVCWLLRAVCASVSAADVLLGGPVWLTVVKKSAVVVFLFFQQNEERGEGEAPCDFAYRLCV